MGARIWVDWEIEEGKGCKGGEWAGDDGVSWGVGAG